MHKHSSNNYSRHPQQTKLSFWLCLRGITVLFDTRSSYPDGSTQRTKYHSNESKISTFHGMQESFYDTVPKNTLRITKFDIWQIICTHIGEASAGEIGWWLFRLKNPLLVIAFQIFLSYSFTHILRIKMSFRSASLVKYFIL